MRQFIFKQNIAFTDIEQSNLLNEYFVSISTIDDQHAILPVYRSLSNSFVDTLTVSEEQINEVIKSSVTNKAVGEDLIIHRVLKNTRGTISKPFAKCVISH